MCYKQRQKCAGQSEEYGITLTNLSIYEHFQRGGEGNGLESSCPVSKCRAGMFSDERLLQYIHKQKTQHWPFAGSLFSRIQG